MKTAGFIGTGKMGGALAISVIEKIGGKNVLLSDNFLEKAQEIAKDSGAECTDAVEVSKNCEFIFLGVKPQAIEETLCSVKDILKENKNAVLVSMAAGVTIERIESILGFEYPIIRIMPNTAVAVGEGAIVYSPNDRITKEKEEKFCSILSLSGILERIDEKLIDAAMAVSGCGPAFVYYFINALKEGGVECGLDEGLSLKLAEQTLLGAAKLAIESKKDPKELQNDVCSKGGTTIEGIYVLENAKTDKTIENAVKAAFEKAKKL